MQTKELIAAINACLTQLGKPNIKSVHTRADGEKRLAALQKQIGNDTPAQVDMNAVKARVPAKTKIGDAAEAEPAPTPATKKATQTRKAKPVRKAAEEDKEVKRPVLAVEDAGRDTTGVTEARLRAKVPAVFAEKPAKGLSEKYAFMSTWDLINPLLAQGYVVTAAQQNFARDKHDLLTTRHMVRLRHTDIKPMVGDVYPELTVVNGHNGNVKFMLAAGLFRLVCSNGMVIGSNAVAMATKHMGDPAALRSEAQRVIEHAQQTSKVVKEWAATELTRRQQFAFARDAAALAYGEQRAPGFDPEVLLAPRRTQDNEPTLWHVFNRVQENVMRGGMQYTNANSRTVQTRGLTRVKRTVGFNMDLWNLAERYAQRSTEDLLA